MRQISKIIIHCSATPPAMDIGVAEIRRWHTEDNKWPDVGYHGVIRRDGTLESGRPMHLAGFHCKGQNADSIGLCLVGGVCGGPSCTASHTTWASGQRGEPENNFTPAQWETLRRTVRDLLKKFPGAYVHGHNEFADKACPSFDVRAWWAAQNG